MNHEESFVRAFIVPEKRSRYLELLKNPKRRREILARLNHDLDYDASLATAISSAESNPENLERLLRRKGARDVCHVVGDELELDGREVRLAEGLEAADSHDFGAVACAYRDGLLITSRRRRGTGLF
jgi:hypothetical protein